MGDAVLVLCPDMIFATKIFTTAKALSITAQGVRSIEALQEKIATGNYRLLVVDLNANGVDAIAAVRAAKATPQCPPIVAFLSHVQVELAKAAEEAGADRVMPRSAFSGKLEDVLRGNAG